jgi:mannose-6-phosphate isomerase-like protein (cupin superfamily)/catechol 2,3-dioxygenase-like lactoylglutathione lyase family enzyme
MTMTDVPAQSTRRQLASEPDTSRAWWFLGTLAVLRNPIGAPRSPAVIELTVPPGGSPPRHVHEALDDSFLLLEGEVVVRCGNETLVARPGAYVVLPHGVEHTFRVTSRVPARLLLVHADDSFLHFIETLGTPTTEHRLPPPGEFDADGETIVRVSAEHGAPIVGPSLEEDDARAHTGSDAPPLGAVNHVSLVVSDLRRSESWYTDALGLIRVDGEIAEDGTGHVALLHPQGGWVLGLASGAEPRTDHVAFSCVDRDALIECRASLAQRGLEPGTITDAPYGSGFVLRDPDGLEMELFAPPALPA